MVLWHTRYSQSHVSQWSDSQQNQGVSQISLLFEILMVGLGFKLKSDRKPCMIILKFQLPDIVQSKPTITK